MGAWDPSPNENEFSPQSTTRPLACKSDTPQITGSPGGRPVHPTIRAHFHPLWAGPRGAPGSPTQSPSMDIPDQ